MLLRCTTACRTNQHKALRLRHHLFSQLDINKLWYLLKGGSMGDWKGVGLQPEA